MTIELCTVGGYNEVGRNMTAIKVDDEVVICDMGFYLQKIVDFEEEGGHRQDLSADELIQIDAIPDDRVLSSWRNNVKAIIPSHCHLDHIGAIPYLAGKYNAPVIGTPYTIEVLNTMIRDDRLKMPNPTKKVNPNGFFKVGKNIEIELINMTHSTLQTAMVVIHTKYGSIIYANDFKFDNHPVLGKRPNYERLKELGKENVIALIVDSLYSAAERKTPSEKVAREMLKDVMLGTDNEGHSIIATTFASNLARLRSIIDFGKKLNRKVLFLGRSLMKYTLAAEAVDLVNFSKEVEIVGYRRQIEKKLEDIKKHKEKYLIVCTGSQGEPESVLARMVNGQLPFNFREEDHVIFSCKTIPVEPNFENRKVIEKKLKERKARIFTNIHTSGHCSREDLRDLINMVQPRNIIPAHGTKEMLDAMAELASEMGYKVGKDVRLMKNGQKIGIM